MLIPRTLAVKFRLRSAPHPFLMCHSEALLILKEKYILSKISLEAFRTFPEILSSVNILLDVKIDFFKNQKCSQLKFTKPIGLYISCALLKARPKS